MVVCVAPNIRIKMLGFDEYEWFRLIMSGITGILLTLVFGIVIMNTIRHKSNIMIKCCIIMYIMVVAGWLMNSLYKLLSF